VASEEPIQAGAAGRYASALFELAEQDGKVAEVDAHLASFDAMLAQSPDLTRLIKAPVFSAEEQVKAITAIVERAGIGGLSGNFLKLVAHNRRLFMLPQIIKEFRRLVSRARGEVDAEVTSAHALNDQQITALKDALRASVGKDVRLNIKVDPSLLGGLVVKVGSRMIDSSLRTKLNSLKTRMKEVR
jgi:F-type H+-transporting ATPase subunit delta